MAADSSYVSQRNHTEDLILNAKNEQSLGANDPILTIPLVVHIIHKGEKVGVGSNLSDQQIYDAIQGLNDRFSGKLGANLDTKIRFCLAVRDPDGNYTTGINRVDGTVLKGYDSVGLTSYVNQPGAYERDVKDLSRWPVTEYYNIWVVHRIVGYGGFAYYPTTTPFAYDGTTINAVYMNYTSPLLTHEVGHGLNLYHVFEQVYTSCTGDKDCDKKGDRVCDTPPTVNFGSGYCQEYGVCKSAYPWTNTRYNYMSYCGSTDRFTEGQVTRMRSSIALTVRDSLLHSKACVPGHNNDLGVVDFVMCDSSLNTVVKNFGANTVFRATVKLAVNNTVKVSYNWTGRLRTYEQDTLLIATQLLTNRNGLNLKSWSEVPNGVKDTINLNDTFVLDTVFAPLMSGTYTVGGGSSDFSLLTDVAEALNNRGICGPVVFELKSGTYDEQVKLKQIRGSSRENTITFQSSAMHPDSVHIVHSIYDEGDNYIFFLDGTDFLRLRNLTFDTKGNINYSTVLHLANNACNNEVSHCIFNGQNQTWSYNYLSALVYSPRSVDSANVFRHNEFRKGGFGIFLLGQGNPVKGIEIDSNLFLNQVNTPVYMVELTAPKITHNEIQSNAGIFNGFYLSTCYDEIEIRGNRISGKVRGGMELSGCRSLSRGKAVIANNYIQTSMDYNNPGVYLRSCYGVQMIHNTIEQKTRDTLSRNFCCIGSGTIEAYNNIFANSGGGYAMYFNRVDFDHSQFDNNDVFSTGSNLIYADSNFTSLASWRTYASNDFNSISVDPKFRSGYLVCEPKLKNGGKFFPNVPIDIEGINRDQKKPSIGAKELDLDELALGGDTLVCDSLRITPGLKGGKYEWSNGDTSATLTVKSSGTYSLTYTDNCASQTDTIDVEVQTRPLVKLGKDTTVCIPYTLKSPQVYDNLLWSTGDTTDSVAVSRAGTYWLRVGNMCGYNIDSISLSTDSVPVVDLGMDVGSCDSVVLKERNELAGRWSDGSTDDTLFVGASGTYWLEVSNICGTGADSVDVEIYPKPLVDLGNDTAACALYILSVNTNGQKVVWNTGDTTSSISIDSSGYYYPSITNTYGCSEDADSIFVRIDPLPHPDLGRDTTLNDDETYVARLNQKYSTYNWSNGTSADTVLLIANQLDSVQYIWVQVMDSNGCEGSDTITIRVESSVSVGILSGGPGVKVYPNPVRENLHINAPKSTIRLFDPLGREVAGRTDNQSEVLINVSGLPSGIYLLVIDQEKELQHFRYRILVE